MKKVLIITYYWPPAGGAGVQRWLKFAKYLPEHGWTPIIYTAENPESPALDTSLLDDIYPSTEIHKTFIWEPFDWYRRFTGRKATDKLGAGFLSESKSVGITEKIAVWVRGNFFIPDAKCFWIKPSVNYLKRYLKDHPVDLIVSTGPPHTTHLIALGLQKKLDIKWIADFRDPWTEIDFFHQLKLTRLANKIHHHLEKKVICNADRVVTIGKSMAESFHEKYNVKPVVITNGFDEEDFNANTYNPDLKFKIVHIGSINKDRNHEIFWKSISELLAENEQLRNKLLVHLIGKNDVEVKNDVEKYGLSNYVTFTPYLNHRDALMLEQQASLLYLPINNTPNAKGIITGKVFEYLGAGRPILTIAPTDGDLAAIINMAGNNWISDFNDMSGLKRNIETCFKFFLEGKLESNSLGAEKFTRKNLTKQLVIEFDKLLR